MAMIDMIEFKPCEAINGYPPIEDHGLIGGGANAALVGLDGAIDWDSPPLFCRLLDVRRGGLLLSNRKEMVESRNMMSRTQPPLLRIVSTQGMACCTDFFRKCRRTDFPIRNEHFCYAASGW